MVLVHSPICDFGAKAPEFSLADTAGRLWTLQACAGSNGLLVCFICNHCPYVQAINQKLVRDTLELQELGVNSVAIMSNDYTAYPEDAPDRMRKLARALGYPFPYLLDETQKTARDYGAVCTPDFFGYNANLELQYRGRLDDSGRHASRGDARRELFLAMKQIAATGKGPADQVATMGCSLKWRDS